MVREEELVQKAREVREALIEMAAREIDATHIEVGQIKAKDDTRKLLTVRVGGANRYVPYAGHDTSEFTVGDYWAIIFDDYGTIRLGWWTSNNAGAGTVPLPPITASDVANVPAGGIAATDVQAAINELDGEKAGTHNLLDGSWHPDTVAQAVTRGSLIVGDSTPEWNELPIGAAGRVLTVVAGDVAWAAPGGGVAAHNILDGNVHLDTVAQAVTRGSLIVGDSTPEWNEVVIGAANRIFLSDGADAGWGQADHGAALVGLLDDDHTIYFLADCTRAFGGDPIPDGADTRSLGSVDAEWLNIYVGEAGKIYFRLDQSVNLYSSAAGVLKTDDHFHATRVFVGDGLVGSPSFAFISDVDTGLYRIGANDLGFTTNSTLALELNAVQQALVTNGTVAAPGLTFITDPDTGLYRLGANRIGFATDGTFAVEIDALQNVGIGLTPTANMAGVSIEQGLLTLKERATPVADANYGKIYPKNDNKLYFQDGAGVEHELGVAAPGTGDWHLIEDIHLVGDGSIDFTGIPDTYKHLKIICSLRSDRADVSDMVLIRFNNDSGNNYDFTRQLSRAAGPLTAEGIGVSYIYNGCIGNTGPANVFDGSEILIPDYTDTGNQKTCTVQGTLKQANLAANVFILTSAGWWRSTAAINRVTLVPDLGTDFKAGSRATLYGLD